MYTSILVLSLMFYYQLKLRKHAIDYLLLSNSYVLLHFFSTCVFILFMDIYIQKFYFLDFGGYKVVVSFFKVPSPPTHMKLAWMRMFICDTPTSFQLSWTGIGVLLDALDFPFVERKDSTTHENFEKTRPSSALFSYWKEILETDNMLLTQWSRETLSLREFRL